MSGPRSASDFNRGWGWLRYEQLPDMAKVAAMLNPRRRRVDGRDCLFDKKWRRATGCGN